MSIRMIAVDLDGTLLASDSVTVPEENIRALRRAAERGAEIVLASGRSLVMMEDAAEQLGCVDCAVSALGAVVTDRRTGRRLAERELTPEQRRAAMLRPARGHGRAGTRTRRRRWPRSGIAAFVGGESPARPRARPVMWPPAPGGGPQLAPPRSALSVLQPPGVPEGWHPRGRGHGERRGCSRGGSAPQPSGVQRRDLRITEVGKDL